MMEISGESRPLFRLGTLKMFLALQTFNLCWELQAVSALYGQEGETQTP